MTREQWKQMTPDQRRIKVAELCGWNLHKWMGLPCLTDDPTEYQYIRNGELLRESNLPDVETDLNAMHEAEQHSIIFESWRDTKIWMDNLCRCSKLGCLPESEPEWAFVLQATAAQRAEAFVLTLEPGDL